MKDKQNKYKNPEIYDKSLDRVFDRILRIPKETIVDHINISNACYNSFQIKYILLRIIEEDVWNAILLYVHEKEKDIKMFMNRTFSNEEPEVVTKCPNVQCWEGSCKCSVDNLDCYGYERHCDDLIKLQKEISELKRILKDDPSNEKWNEKSLVKELYDIIDSNIKENKQLKERISYLEKELEEYSHPYSKKEYNELLRKLEEKSNEIRILELRLMQKDNVIKSLRKER